jgi:TrmH family RNA methyltransferase
VKEGSLVPRFGRARRDDALAVLEGLHAVKHAMRFGAEIELAVTDDAARLEALAERLAPDIAPALAAIVREVEPGLFAALAPMPPPTGVLAIAARRAYDPAAILSGERHAPVVVLENPRDLGNVGACIRVAAAAGAAGLISLGGHDLWHPDAVRGAAGLHYALPVARVQELPDDARPLLALDPDGEELDASELDARSILVFGTERDGLSPELLARAGRRLAIPMRAGVSSLNLATSVSAVLFSWRLSRPR